MRTVHFLTFVALLVVANTAAAQTRPSTSGRRGSGSSSSSTAAPTTPPAQPPVTDPDQEARLNFQAGQVAFDSGAFERALESFERAYELSHRPALLYNIGATAERLRLDARALEAFRQFLVEVPDTPSRAQVEARIRILEQSVAAQEAANAAPQTPTEPAAVTAPAAAEDSDAGGSSGTGLLIGAGGAAALALTGGIYWANRGSELSTCRAGSGSLVCINEGTIERQRNAAVAITIIGAVAAPALVATAIIVRRHSAHHDSGTAFACAPGLLSAACVGTF